MHRFLESVAAQYMSRNVVTVPRTLTLRELEALFENHDFNLFPVVEDARVVGVVTKFDFLEAFIFTTARIVPDYQELMARTVDDVMTRAVVDVEPDAPLTHVLELMVSLKARSFPVRERHGALAGVIAREDIMRALKDSVRLAGRP
jgi:CBS domain-containing protein